MPNKIKGFSKNWENIYKSNSHLSIWPWSDVVTYINLFCKNSIKFKNILELGCGAGANIPFFLYRNNNYFGLDGSKIIINRLKKKFPKLKNNLAAVDFTKDIKYTKNFDVIIDRGSSIHNTSERIDNMMKLIANVLRQKGIYIGVDLFASDHTASKLGKYVDDNTRTNINSKQFKGVGNVHFFNKNELVNLFTRNNYKILHLEHVKKNTIIGNEKIANSTYNIVALKLK